MWVLILRDSSYTPIHRITHPSGPIKSRTTGMIQWHLGGLSLGTDAIMVALEEGRSDFWSVVLGYF
jgi:hypothetical protein